MAGKKNPLSSVNSIIRMNRDFDKAMGYPAASVYNMNQMRRDDAATRSLGANQSPVESRMGLPKIDRRANKYKKSY